MNSQAGDQVCVWKGYMELRRLIHAADCEWSKVTADDIAAAHAVLDHPSMKAYDDATGRAMRYLERLMTNPVHDVNDGK